MASVLFSMGNKHINIKAILFCKWKATLVFVSLIFHQFAKDRLVSSSWTSDYEFCETRWFEFLSDKKKWNRTCGNETMNMSWCCIAEKDYLLERFKRFSHACPLEGKHIFHLDLAFSPNCHLRIA